MMDRTHCAVSALLLALSATLAHAGQPDPRIGEWRENHYAGAVGLYMIYEDLGGGVTRTHTGENLAVQNRLHDDSRCDGNFYPRLDSAGKPNGTSSRCEIVNSRTVRITLRNTASDAWTEAEGKWILSDDGTHSVGSFVRKDADGKVVELVTRMFTRNRENCLNHADDAKFRACQQRTAPPRPDQAAVTSGLPAN